MKNSIKWLAGVVTVIVFGAFSWMPQALNIGDKAPMTEHVVTDVSGRTLNLSDVAGVNGLLVMFSCNTCPWVAKWEDRYDDLYDESRANNIGMIALNPNERIRNKGESMEDMRKRAQKENYEFFYALDEDHELADAFGATRTPEIFLFDKDLKLVYHGAIDDNANDAGAVEESYALNAIRNMVNGSAIDKPVTKSLGCTIKRIK